CRSFLIQELATVPANGVVLVLGRLAHDSVVRALGSTLSQMPFRHAGELELSDQRTLVSSYHCSRYNPQTRRLTQSMFNDVFSRVRELLS
ncbi:MAG TPA: uracil-DNA glycosylase, partial [Gammaproteobacteria bacterium]|nr:uracil-DNA glycosylase [Gammaproteobacteria bacterium]